MKRIGYLIVVMFLLIINLIPAVSFAENNGNSLDEVITNNQTSQVQQVDNSTSEKNKSFINGLNEASDLSANVEGANKVTAGIKRAVGFVINIISYALVALLALRVVLDLTYIGLPFVRGFLGNGYNGVAQSGSPTAGGFGMGGFGGGMGMNNFGWGFGSGMGGFGGGMGMSRPGMGGQQPHGKIQWVSNAALNAVASESTIGPDGKSISPFKVYAKDMILVLVLTPALLVLAITGVLTSLGLSLGSLLVDAIRSIQGMM